MANFELIRFSDDEQLARAAAVEWLKDLEQGTRQNADYCIALSGGRIARRLFSEVADQFKKRPELLSAVQFFWGDERCVPPTDAESNYAIAQELLLQPLDVPERQIHR